MPQHRRLQDRVAIVTGGARGIGEAAAIALQRAGAVVVIADRNAAGAAAMAERNGISATRSSNCAHR